MPFSRDVMSNRTTLSLVEIAATTGVGFPSTVAVCGLEDDRSNWAGLHRLTT
jgi:hypothetical protein